ncbi:2-phosphoxylose phosphatase 1 isoform X1 [Tribolium madens]|uniref:2-phosphoxylose phosphatase 1 isoform X1 n=2 Tax=Tribolium madens TaxID=41895 RepID=UPI001CF72BDA|nr:2-phosphoxylose phosphatase 1 isoform X1 [Tribolium madens]
MTFDVPRMPNKALHCYLLMIIWILLLVAGVYKFLEPRQRPPEPAVSAELFHNLANDIKTRRIFKICNFPHEISDGDEGVVQSKKWVMTGVIILIRHGDRGPLQHVRNISAVNCGSQETEKLISYKSYLHNVTISGRAPWTGPGPFHDFPLLPTHPRQCQLGQLTMQGISQLLKLGQILRDSYLHVWPKIATLTPSEVLVYSTRYRRTFQSALSFLFALIPTETFTKLSIFESQSMNFCFKDCGCPITDKLLKGVKKSISHQLKSHPAVAVLAEATGKSLFSTGAEQGALGGDPHAVRDALLTYVCHGSGLPCETPTNCIKRQNVAGVFAYTDWVNYQKWRNVFWKRLCLLRSYGLIRHIVQQMLHMVSNNGPFLVLYSGHDHTVEQLTTALGLQNDPLLLRYGARVVFEVYQNYEESHNGAKGIYFRVLSNGRDVTKQVSFCKDIVFLENKVSLCKIEDIVRFIHDDYFVSLNVTNFKDACSRNE